MRIALETFRKAGLDASASSLFVLLALAAVGARADEPGVAAAESAVIATESAVIATESAGSDDAASLVTLAGTDGALSEADLTEQRAMAKIEIERITVSETDQDGTVSGNVAVGDTGHNSIADHAFDGASGLIMSVQNTGNNVLIQNSTTINVSVEQ